ncbi:long-chain fatty acid--CoA ligase [Simiduia curdlanivorans]|uniref:Long-chain fatty acid--CoA ligase n=1 Tax=Simiduia curdlanivorans TaxID=1492769 RepID=A0ABV8V2W9_9GAMM|nr:long-chain fatty acid--CoA ligase [Simiduia curdlanivorans]MDN3640940.1 long-chain fatty acid--CoA ligase [Simiduia curdlanivorans]
MNGLVPDRQLNIVDILRHAVAVHGQRQVVSVDAHGKTQRCSYRELGGRVAQLARALTDLGVKQGECVSTLAWNDQRHLELYFAVPALGLICHTVNPRLFSEQLSYILADANCRWLFVDPQFMPQILPLLPNLTALKGVVVLTEPEQMQGVWVESAPALQWHCYDSLLLGQADSFEWPTLNENTPSGCCYTSGTTGNPKGVLYSHRSTVLHSMALALPDAGGLSADDAALVIVPMFHVNGWGLPYAALMVGANLILPGRFMGDGACLAKLIDTEAVTIAAGVPTVWQALIAHMTKHTRVFSRPLKCMVGGAACTEKLRADLEQLGGQVRPAWGMTETSPVGAVNRAGHGRHRLSPGQPVFGVELRVVDALGQTLPNDGESSGELQIRGPWIARGYIGKKDADEFLEDGWFSTGDVACLFSDGHLHITDRAKDVIKSGGEWISSLALEEVASGYPGVAAAAVIAMPHPRWDERPLLLVTALEQATIDQDNLLRWFDGKVAKWWQPDAVKVIDTFPLTATGKVDKKVLRQQYAIPES